MAEMLPDYMGYDRTMSTFSPDGRLFQVEYAKEAVKRGLTSLGMTFNGGVILATVKQEMELAVPGAMEKLFKIDEHIGIVSAGLLADARVLINQLRVHAQINRITYEEPIDVLNLSKILGDRLQFSTLYGGMRPFGVSFLIGGVDDNGSHLVEADPSGMLYEWKAYAIGRGASTANKIFETKYKTSIKEEEALKTVIEVIKKVEKVKNIAKAVDIAIIREKDRKFTLLSESDIKKLL
ncbi:MAG: archaeal proteasome endopeptidase complex subunit alpha [Candidatus Aenigmatarchaeota archaeon]